MLNIENKLKSIIVKIAKKQIVVSDINDDTNLINDLGFDSVQMIEMIVEIETNFNIEIDDEDMDIDILVKYADLKDLIIRKINV